MKITPVGNRVLIEREVRKAESEGGILLPGIEKKELMRGKIVAIGKVPDFAVGDNVIFSDYTGVRVGETHIILEEKDIVAKYSE